MCRWLVVIALLLAALAGQGCVEADLGPAPLYCNPGEPRCPRGYECVRHEGRDYCLREGADPSEVLRDGG